MNHYEAANMQLWQCRTDATFGDFFCHNVLPCNLKQDLLIPHKFATLGFASDLGVQRNFGRVGAKLAPNIIRQFISRLAIPHLEQCYDCGNIVVDNNDSLLNGQKMLAQAVSKIVRAGITPIILGGGHETAYGHYLGLLDAIDDDIAILNFDAHFDLRPVLATNEGNSGTPFRQIYNACNKAGRDFNYYCIGIQPRANIKSLYDFAHESNCTYIEANDLRNDERKAADLINTIITTYKHIYVTVCLDVFHYSYAPGVSAPQSLGIDPYVVMDLLHLLGKSNKVLSFDIVELNPNYDIDNHTARLAANLISTFYYS